MYNIHTCMSIVYKMKGVNIICKMHCTLMCYVCNVSYILYYVLCMSV